MTDIPIEISGLIVDYEVHKDHKLLCESLLNLYNIGLGEFAANLNTPLKHCVKCTKYFVPMKPTSKYCSKECSLNKDWARLGYKPKTEGAFK